MSKEIIDKLFEEDYFNEEFPYWEDKEWKQNPIKYALGEYDINFHSYNFTFYRSDYRPSQLLYTAVYDGGENCGPFTDVTSVMTIDYIDGLPGNQKFSDLHAEVNSWYNRDCRKFHGKINKSLHVDPQWTIQREVEDFQSNCWKILSSNYFEEFCEHSYITEWETHKKPLTFSHYKLTWRMQPRVLGRINHKMGWAELTDLWEEYARFDIIAYGHCNPKYFMEFQLYIEREFPGMGVRIVCSPKESTEKFWMYIYREEV